MSFRRAEWALPSRNRGLATPVLPNPLALENDAAADAASWLGPMTHRPTGQRQADMVLRMAADEGCAAAQCLNLDSSLESTSTSPTSARRSGILDTHIWCPALCVHQDN